jgi:acyl-CoA reductase-like NAD-dependent aldehyde dehydrogenase
MDSRPGGCQVEGARSELSPTATAGGDGVSNVNTPMYTVTDPATGDLVSEYPAATDETLDRALGAATNAFSEWSRRAPVAERAD